MLLGQNGGGDQNRRLLSVQHAFHHAPQCHLRLAIAHISAQQPVHGPGPLHVRLDLLDGPKLVVRLRVRKCVLKFLLPRGIGRKGEAGLLLPRGVQGDEPLGKVLGGGLGLGFGPGPLRSAQLVQPGVSVVLAAADVLADLIQRRNRHVQAVPGGIVDFDIVLFHAVHRHSPNAGEPAHAVLGVDHQIAGGEVGGGLKLLPSGVLLELAPLLGGGGQLPLRQHREAKLGPLAARAQSPGGQPNLAGGGHGGVAQVQRGGNISVLQQPQQIFRPGLAAAEN
ncbi:hypothetical protein SDC9_95994 [bioreactor metagenome]|uniref:Uncharacterized protein n=1 Tax=bioreactor metagenome TaxID=1076179 RepID=A0A645A8L6_9ZZZZ